MKREIYVHRTGTILHLTTVAGHIPLGHVTCRTVMQRGIGLLDIKHYGAELFVFQPAIQKFRDQGI